ncbi:MAG: NAD(+) kinase [Proteobacteria bacterium]|nr:NAD(+) kinase [Pseudomonadota bacterium]
MKQSFTTVAIVARRHTEAILASIDAVEAFMQQHGVKVLFGAQTLAAIPNAQPNGVARESVSDAAMGASADLVIVVGGDGSLLGFGREMAASGVPVVGVNRGGLGFLAAISPEQIENKFGEILNGQFTIEEHFLLQARVLRDGEVIAEQSALNDVVVSPGGVMGMMEFALWLDDEFVYNQRSDGLIVASPTGSTAYALSAGGPIMHPRLDAIVVVPMFPHTLTSRPLVVPGNQVLRLRLLNDSASAPLISCDSQVQIRFAAGDEIQISKHPNVLRLLSPSDHSFYEACRSKLDWASRLGGQSFN